MTVLAVSRRRLGDLPELCRALGQVKVAAALANDAPAPLLAIARRLADADPELLAVLDADPLAGGGGIVVHRQVNELLGADDAGRSQSTADVCHTAARLAVGAALDHLDGALGALEVALAGAAERFGDAPTLARTCLQDAVAVPASLLPEGASAAVARRRGTLAAARAPLDLVVLGATVVGTGAGAPATYRSTVVGHLGVACGRPLQPHPSPASALQHGDDLLDVLGALEAAALVVAKVAQDLRLLSSGPGGGLGEVRLPKVMEGSTFFAAKNNPVVPETAVQAASLAAGAAAQGRAAAARAELHLAGYDLTVAVAALDAAGALAAGTEALATDAVAGMELDAARCAELATFATPTKGDRP
ncbi:MAG: lyase family protein [Acidimicrobiales bacterium]